MPISVPLSFRGTDGEAGWHLTALDIDVLHNQNVLGQGIRIAVIDTGVYKECAAIAGAAIEDYDGQGRTGGDDHVGHGTSMIAILVGDELAVCPGAAIISIGALTIDPDTDGGSATVEEVAGAIELALKLDVDIISISAGQREPSARLDAAVRSATDQGVVVVGAGDESSTSICLYPASCDTAISVTRSSPLGEIVVLETPSHVDVAAPGENIATYEFDRPTTLSGTSAATAIVAGVCALLLGEVPDSRRRELGKHLRAFLMETARPAVNATGPGDCKIVAPRAALAAIEAWL